MFKKLLNVFKADETAPAPDRSEAEAKSLIAAGNAAEDAGRAQEAHGMYLRAVSLAPRLPSAHLNLGIVQETLGDGAAARSSYSRVLELDEANPFGAYNLAKLEFTQGSMKAAEEMVRRSLAHKADFVEAWVLLSNVLDERGELDAAADAIEQALRLKPGLAGAWFNRAVILDRLGRIDEAVDSAARAAQLEPVPDYLAMHVQMLKAQGFCAEALGQVQHALALAPDRPALRSLELFLLNVVDGFSAEELYRRHRAWGAEMEARTALLPPCERRAAHGRLRVGFVSEDFRVHPVALFLLPLLERRSRDRFEVFCYSLSSQEDHITRRIEALADRWMVATALADAELAQAVRGDGVDILVDLGGHTSSARLAVFAARPAPLQVSWMGYLNTTGLTRIDHRLTDARCDPPARSQPLHSERLLFLPESQWCYRPFVDVELAPEAPCERHGFVTFGSFNSVAKLTEAAAARWGRILKALPASRLLVADVASARKKESILAVVEREGAAREQVQFAPRTDLVAYFRLMDQVDIALDSFPYGGGTTTFDVLWMGVPVLTAVGSLSVSRSAASVLSALGLEEWIAPSVEDFEALAIERARDLDQIARLRRSLRERLRASPLMDEARFVADFEALLLQAWQARDVPVDRQHGRGALGTGVSLA